MTMPIATQVADAITTIKGRLYAKAGELYWRKPSNGTIYQLTPTGGGGGVPLTPVVKAPGTVTVAPGELALCNLHVDGGAYDVSLDDGTTNGQQAAISATGDQFEFTLDNKNINGALPSFFGAQTLGMFFVWDSVNEQWNCIGFVYAPAD